MKKIKKLLSNTTNFILMIAFSGVIDFIGYWLYKRGRNGIIMETARMTELGVDKTELIQRFAIMRDFGCVAICVGVLLLIFIIFVRVK